MLAVLLLAIDATVLYLAVPSMSAGLRPTAEQILWIGDGYSLAIAGLLVLMGNWSDRIGRKRILLVGSVLFGLASLFAAMAVSAEMLIVARFVLGAAGATILPSTLSLIRNIFTDDAERTRAIAIWAGAFGAGSAIGPLVGGVLLQYFWWGSVFLVNIPVMVVVVVAGLFLLPESRDPNFGRLDVLSALLSIASTALFIYAVTHVVVSGVTVGIAMCLTVSVVAGWWFIRRQRRLDEPLLDVTLFQRPAFTGAVVSNAIAILALTGSLFIFSQYMQLARGHSPLQVGLVELPSALSSMIVALFVGIAVNRIGRGRAVALSLFVTALGLVGIAMTVQTDSLVGLAACLVPVGFGVGLAMTLTGDAVLTAAPPDKAGRVSAITETGNELGIVLGIAILGSLVSLVYRASVQVPPSASAEVRSHVNDSLASALSWVEPESALAHAAREAFVTAVQTASLAAAILTTAAAAIAWWLIPSPRGTFVATTETVRQSE